jgi:D-alanyl-D-alanine carboxypeptidase/D-alanyl-D-alanine-endopeptidase (penicillin-binding protein 4)
MPRFRRLLTVALFLVLAAVAGRSAYAGNDLAAKIDAVINGPDYRQARWGILLVDGQSGETLYAHNPEQMFLPASTTKLYTCATALAAFGPDFKFETPVYARGDMTDGRLRGDLILVASGDLTLGGRTDANGKLAFKDHDHTYANSLLGDAELTDTDPLAGLKALAKQVREAGIRRVEGEVLVDDRLFERSQGSGSGPDLLTAIMVNDNAVDAIATPGDKAGEPARVRMRPRTSFIQMDAQVTTAAEGTEPRLELRAVGPQRFTIRGHVPAKGKPRVRIYSADDPVNFARALFIETLRREGVAVDASPVQPPQADLPDRESYAKLHRVALFTSPPFAEVIKVTLKVSHNLYASTLPLLVAARNGKRTIADGLRLEHRFLTDLGVDVNTISFAGGAGGANADSVTPRATVQLLQAMAKRPDYPVYRDCLPVLGVDGTLADVVPGDSPARGKVRAKTGTLYWHDVLNDRSVLRSKALAGTMTTAGGRTLFLAVFVNDVPLPHGVEPSREGKVLGHLCEIIYQNVP